MNHSCDKCYEMKIEPKEKKLISWKDTLKRFHDVS